MLVYLWAERIDVDNSNSLSRKELTHILTVDFGLVLSEEELEDAFAELVRCFLTIAIVLHTLEIKLIVAESLGLCHMWTALTLLVVLVVVPVLVLLLCCLHPIMLP